MLDKCSINSKSKTKKETCLTKKDLLRILKKLTNVSGINVNILTKKKIHKIIEKIVKLPETKWYKVHSIPLSIKKKLLNYTFKLPLQGNSKIDGYWWLTSTQIDSIMKQFVKNRNSKGNYSFSYFGSFSADSFNDTLLESLTQVLYKKRVGIVFNTDILSGPGIHWVAVYINKKSVEYFDPNGIPPNNFILTFLNTLNRKIIINKYQYQTVDGTCGLWAVLFLMKKALHKKLNKDTDFTVNNLRRIFFV
jgi:hypothetical protein